MTTYLTFDALLRIAQQEGFVVRDAGLLQAAAARPQTSVFGEDAYPDLPAKTAVLIDSISNMQPLVDGNKRLALLAASVFLGLNDWELDLTDDEAYDVIMWASGSPHPTWQELAVRLTVQPLGTADAG